MNLIDRLVVFIVGDNKELKSSLIDSEKLLNKNTQSITAIMTKAGTKMRGIGLGMSAAITAPLILIGKKSLDMAMDVVESENLFEVSMGNMSDAAREWSIKLREDLGLNEYEVRKSVATFNVMFDSMGLGEEAAYDMAKGLTQLSYDMASFYNLEPEVAFQKLQAGISGEAEPLKRLGILINETTIQQWAWNNGLVKTGEQLNEQQKVLARYGAIMEQTSKAQGDMARTIESPANQLRILKDQVNMLMIDLGKELIPIFQDVMKVTKKLVTWFGNLTDEQKSLAVKIGLVAAAAGPALMIFGQMAITIPSVTKSVIALNVATKGWLATLGLYGAAIGAALAATGAYYYKLAEETKKYAEITDSTWRGLLVAGHKMWGMELPGAIRKTIEATEESTEATEEQIPVVKTAKEVLEELTNQNIELGYTQEKAAELAMESAKAMGYFADETDEATGEVEDQTDAIGNLRSEFNSLISTLFDGIDASNNFQESEWALQKAQEEVTEAIKKYGEGSREAEEAINNLDGASKEYINTAYGVYTSTFTTKEEQEAAREKALEYGKQLVDSGKWGEDAFVKMALQFGLSGNEIILKAQELGLEIDQATINRNIEITADASNVYTVVNEVHKVLGKLPKKIDIPINLNYGPSMPERPGGALGGIFTGKEFLRSMLSAFEGAMIPKFDTGGILALLHPPEIVLNAKEAMQLVWNMANRPVYTKGGTKSGITNYYNITSPKPLTESEIRRQVDLLSREQGYKMGVS